jgi:PAS domain S-box-containing protein
VLRADGLVGWVRAKGRCFRDEHGRPHHFDGITYDITRRKEEEEQLRRTEERLRLAVEAGRLGVWYGDLPLHKLDCSPGIKRYLGIPLEATVTMDLFYEGIHPDDRAHVRRAVETATAYGTDFDVEYRVIALTDLGRSAWVQAIGRCFRDGHGRPHHFDGIIRDITAEKLEKEERAHLLKELSEANLLRERLLGIVVHDLKSPLAAVDMTAKLLREDLDDEDSLHSVDRILRGVSRMKRLIDQLLDFARIRAHGGMPVVPGSVDLTQLCSQVVDELRAANPEVTIALSADGDCWGQWDADRLSQVVANVLANAVQHGSGELAVRVSGAGEDVTVTVHNRGEPIPAHLLPVLFDPFRQGERREKGQRQSVGLGLYIAQQIVLAHQGLIEVRSPDGDGTTVVIRLPRRYVQPEAEGRDASAS